MRNVGSWVTVSCLVVSLQIAPLLANLPAPVASRSLSSVQQLVERFPVLKDQLATTATFTAETISGDGQAVVGQRAQGATANGTSGAALKPEEAKALDAFQQRGKGPSIKPFFANAFTDPFEIEGGGLRLRYRNLGAQAVTATVEDGKVIYRGAYRDTDSVHTVSRQNAEEFLLLHSPAAPTRFEYEVKALSPDVTAAIDEGSVVFQDLNGRKMQIAAPWLVDGDGQQHTTPVKWQLAPGGVADTYRLTLTLEPRGLVYPLVIDPSWLIYPDNTPVLKQGRYYHTATMLTDGRLLVIGGIDNGNNAFASSEVFDQVEAVFMFGPNMSTPRLSHTATPLRNGKVLIVGGTNGSGNILNSVELFDADANNFALAAPLNVAREQHTATMLPNGKVLVVGGHGIGGPSTGTAINSVELYDPNTNTWVVRASMTSPRERHTATLLQDGTVLVTGGYNGDQTTGTVLNTAEIYNPGTNSWTPLGTMLASGRMRHTATRLNDGTVLIAGGCTTFVYDFGKPCSGVLQTADLYTPGVGLAPIANMLYPRYDHSATMDTDGSVVLFGGRDESEPATQPSANTFEVYRASAGWVIVPPQPALLGTTINNEIPRLAQNTYNARHGHTAVLLPSGQIFVIGGLSVKYCTSNLTTPNTCQRSNAVFYMASLGKFPVTVPDIPTDARAWHTATLLPSGKVLIVGGADPGLNPLSSCYLYDPVTNTWQAAQPLSVARYKHTATLLQDGRVLVIGGTGPSITIPTVEAYDWQLNQWLPVAPLATARYQHTATLMQDGNILVAGGFTYEYGYTVKAEIYNPDKNTWTPTRDMYDARAEHTATLLLNGQVLVVSGFNGLTNGLNAAEKYDPVERVWYKTSLSGLPGARYRHTATMIAGGRVVIIGGYGTGTFGTVPAALKLINIYDPVTNKFSAPPGTCTCRELTTARAGHSATLLGTGQILIAGGWNGAVTPSNTIDTAELYFQDGTVDLLVRDFAMATVTMAPSKPRYAHSATLLPSGRVLIAGGFTATVSTPLREATLYDRALNFDEGWRPVIQSPASPTIGTKFEITIGEQLTVNGTQFTGFLNGGVYGSEASGGNGSANVNTNYPLLVVQSLVNERRFFLAVDPATGWTSTSLKTQAINTLPPGWAMIFVVANGIPSHAKLIKVNKPSTGALKWYFAEGYTGPGFDEYLTIQNPNPTMADLRITYFREGGPTLTVIRQVLENSRDTVKVFDDIEGVGRNNGLGWGVSVFVESINGVGIIVERPMYFTYNGSTTGITGGHNVMGTNEPQTDWYFAEGWTGAGFDEYLTLQNPDSYPAYTTITYYLASGGAPIERTFIVNPQSRYTVVVHDETSPGVGRGAGGTGLAVSAKVSTTNGVKIVAERPMYFRYNGSAKVTNVTDGHNVMGAKQARNTWYFAEGQTVDTYDMYLTIQNPNNADSNITLSYYITTLSGGSITTKNIVVAKNSRFTVVVYDSAQPGGLGRGSSPTFGQKVAVKVESTNNTPVVAERPMYFRTATPVPGITIDGGHAVMGAPFAKTEWYFAEGYTGTGFREYLFVLNPNPTIAYARVIYYVTGQSTTTVITFSIPANARKEIDVNSTTDPGLGPNWPNSAKVESTNGNLLVVERPMYFNYTGSGTSITGGHIVLGFAP